jgi:hypothetical protein
MCLCCDRVDFTREPVRTALPGDDQRCASRNVEIVTTALSRQGLHVRQTRNPVRDRA